MVYFCAAMNCYKTYFNRLIVCTLCFLSSIVLAQEAKTQVNSPDKLDELLAKKIDLDREESEKKQFTIQVYYGNFESSTAVLEAFQLDYPDLPARLVFETPNYKIRSGSFITEREAQEVLIRIKRRYKAAFVLKP
jgi:hypothetical protein